MQGESKYDDTGEGKECKEGKGDNAVTLIDVTQIDVDSSPQPLTSQLDLEVDFRADRLIQDAIWEIKVPA